MMRRFPMASREKSGWFRRAWNTCARPPARSRRGRLVNSARDVGIRLTGPQGTISAGPQPDPYPPLPRNAPDPVSVPSGGQDWLVLSLRVGAAKEGTTPNLWLLSPDTAEDELALVHGRLLTGALLAAALAGVAAWAIAARAVLPLRRLQRRTSGLDPRTSSVRPEHTPTRIAEVDDGLTLVAQQVALHQGRITVSDHPDGGPGTPAPATGGPVLPEPVPGTPTADRSNRLWQVIEEVS